MLSSYQPANYSVIGNNYEKWKKVDKNKNITKELSTFFSWKVDDYIGYKTEKHVFIFCECTLTLLNHNMFICVRNLFINNKKIT